MATVTGGNGRQRVIQGNAASMYVSNVECVGWSGAARPSSAADVNNTGHNKGRPTPGQQPSRLSWLGHRVKYAELPGLPVRSIIGSSYCWVIGRSINHGIRSLAGQYRIAGGNGTQSVGTTASRQWGSLAGYHHWALPTAQCPSTGQS